MKTRYRGGAAALTLLAASLAASCSDGGITTPDEQVTALLSVQPAGGSVDVKIETDVVVRFDHPIAEGMERYAALHEGSVTGPEVAGMWTRSEDGTALTFTPDALLKSATTYALHLGGGMMDADGGMVDLAMHGFGTGGQWATQSMMTGGMGGGMGGQTSGHMGTGWQHPENGTYGMVFTFTTAAG